MKVYLVGGAVRDELMGKIPKDKDYVVTDSSPREMRELGYLQVGQSFSIFLNPKTREEYALARGESLIEDLARRDLTINALARSEEGELIDPFHGQRDIKNKILRHVSSAFADDPLRIFRIARFLAYNPDFEIAEETSALIKTLVETSEFKELSTERIFTEMKLALKTRKPSLFFQTLLKLGALKYHFPELQNLIGVPQRAEYHPEGDAWVHTMLVLDHAADLSQDLPLRYSALVHDLGKGVTPKKVLPRHIGHEEAGIPLVKRISKRLKVPNDWLEAAVVVTRFHLRVHRIFEMKASSIVRMFYEMDAFRKPYLVKTLALGCEADDMGKMKEAVPQGRYLEECFEKIKDISMEEIPSSLTGKAIGDEIRARRVRRLSSGDD
jgi:tRNA nucleotidyltransferase (CCA-adding enzyme)